MFYFGVLLPTVIVVLFFIVFLICWFKCNLRYRFSKPAFNGGSHNSTQSSLVSASSSAYPNGPPSKDYWESAVNTEDKPHSSTANSDTQSSVTHCKYIPGDFSIKSEDWIYMSHDSVRKCREPQVWTTKCGSDSSLDSQASASRPWLCRDSPELERRPSPDILAGVHCDRTLPLYSQFVKTYNRESVVEIHRAPDGGDPHWSDVLKSPSSSGTSSSTPHSDLHWQNNGDYRIEWLDAHAPGARGEPYCAPYAIANIISAPAISV